MRVMYHPYVMGQMEWLWGTDYLEFTARAVADKGRDLLTQEPVQVPGFPGRIRVCLGKEMALAEMKSVALALVQRFDVHVADGHRGPRFVPGLTASIRGDCLW